MEYQNEKEFYEMLARKKAEIKKSLYQTVNENLQKFKETGINLATNHKLIKIREKWAEN